MSQRLVIAGPNFAGRSTILADYQVAFQTLTSGATVFELAQLGGQPDLSRPELSTPATSIFPEPGHSVFRIVEIASGFEPHLHRSDTLDYIVVLSGTARLSNGNVETRLAPGDTVVIAGAEHAWAAADDRPLRLLAVQIGAGGDGKTAESTSALARQFAASPVVEPAWRVQNRRRLILAENLDGRSVFLYDAYLAHPFVVTPHLSLNSLWEEPAAIPPLRVSGEQAASGMPSPPSGSGSCFWLVEFKPMAEAERATMEQTLDGLKDLALQTRSGLHGSRTLTYTAVLEGQMTYVVEDGETTIGAGDMLLQYGVMHSWRNEGDEPALLVAVHIAPN
jgi:quercetin dioxygenase-like cupin family protein